MSTFVGAQEAQGAWERLLTKPLDQAVWHAWEARGSKQDLRSNAVLSKVVKWLSIAGLLAAAGLWSQPAPYDVVVKFVLAGGAMAALLQAFRTWQHTAGRLAASSRNREHCPVRRITRVAQRKASRTMTKHGVTALRWALTSFLMLAATPSATVAGDLSKYRDFKFGTDLSTVAKQAGANPSQANVLHSRPALIQDLKWRPQPLGWSAKTEPAQEIVFSFYDGELFRIEVIYDAREIEGLTTQDLVEAISTAYGRVTTPAVVAKTAGQYGDQDQVVARWQDPEYRFDLIRSSYGRSFTLVGVVKSLEAQSQTAVIEAARLDDKEAPQKEADRIASEGETERAKLAKARLVNKPKFRP